ncbi:MAG: exosortase E/protease, VPEID-CTERM system [Bryobacteraceae bacterium]
MPKLLQRQPGTAASCDPPAPPLFSVLTGSTVYHRVAWSALLFILELIAISVWLDAASLSRDYVVTRLVDNWGAWTLRARVAFASLFRIIGCLRARSVLRDIGTRPATVPVRRTLLAGHFCSLALFGFLSRILFGGSLRGSWTDTVALVWIASGLLAIVLAGLAFLPLETWLLLFRGTGNTWAYAAAMAVLVCWLGNALRLLWAPATRATFIIVKFLLGLFLSPVISDPATATIGSTSFNVVIEPACSGLEGVGLMLVFGILWLWLFRQDFRFPQAILLVPVSLGTAFLLNSVRIAALILIGNAGAPNIALGGFHSQAGWIAFNAIALGLVLGSQHVPWIARSRPLPAPAGSRADNPSALYLAPFLAILAAGMLSRAVAGRFEWLYPLRLFAAAAVLWCYRKRYARLNWAFGWLGPAAGVAVFAMWIALDRLAASSASSGTVPGLSPGHGVAWIAWLSLRTLGAVVTVPIAEELAFRGFLLRRLVAADFERIDFRNTSLFALLGSSVAFGLMHGARWFAGALAGLVYALVLRRRGRIGETIAAHATTNALLAIWVIARGDWRLW